MPGSPSHLPSCNNQKYLQTLPVFPGGRNGPNLEPLMWEIPEGGQEEVSDTLPSEALTQTYTLLL